MAVLVAASMVDPSALTPTVAPGSKPASAVVAPGVVLQPAMRYPLRVKVSPGSWSMSFQSSASVVDVAEDPAWFAW